MKFRKFHVSNPPDPEAETKNNKHNKLPFLRASNPVKRCPEPEPSENVSKDQREAGQEDPFDHLLKANGVNSDQSTNPHGDASSSLGSLAGQRVCRRKPSNFGDAILNSHTGVNILPPFDKLVSKKSGPKRKQQKTSTDGPWKYVDEHVAQLRRKASYLNREEDMATVTETNTVPKQKPDVKPRRDLNQPSRDLTSASCIADIFNEIKGVISSAHPAKDGINKQDNSTSSSVPCHSDSLPSTSSHIHVKGSPAWKPVLVVGKSPEIKSEERILMQEWKNNVTKEQLEVPSTRSSPDVNRTINSVTSSMHGQVSSDIGDKFEFIPQLGESSFQRVPGSANLDINGLNSPWLNMWSPSPKTDKNEE